MCTIIDARTGDAATNIEEAAESLAGCLLQLGQGVLEVDEQALQAGHVAAAADQPKLHGVGVAGRGDVSACPSTWMDAGRSSAAGRRSSTAVGWDRER